MTRDEILKNDLSDLKEGGKVFHGRDGEVTVDTIDVGDSTYPVIIKDRGSHTVSGRIHIGDKYPIIFKSLNLQIAYFQAVKEAEDEKNAWTHNKVRNCDEIGFGTKMVRHGFDHLVCEKTSLRLKAVNRAASVCEFYSDGDLEPSQFYRQDGTEILASEVE